MVVLPCTGDHTCQGVLHSLKSLDVLMRGTVQQRVTIVKSCADYAACHCIGYCSIEHRSDVLQSADVAVARFDDVCHMPIERHVLVKGDSEALQLHGVRDLGASDADSRTTSKLH